jgi:hypothetical protein
MDSLITPPVCVPLAACPPVRRKHTASKLAVAPKNLDLGVFRIQGLLRLLSLYSLSLNLTLS